MIEILATGDVGVLREDPASMFAFCADRLRAADLVIGQLEGVVSERGEPVPNAKLAMRAPPASLLATRAAGYAAMSFAGNHCLDWGYTAFHDTFAHAAAAGIPLAGAGATLDQASAPLMVQAGGRRIALIAASSILPEGYAAEPDRAGCMPMRAHTVYEQIEHDQPGTPARTRSFPHRLDLARLIATIAAARAEADVVLLSLHWGIHMVRATLADYQRTVARAAIDAGVDAVIGHHPHILKGIEVYRGRPIFYSLGNFALEQPHIWEPKILQAASFRHLVSLNPTWDPANTYMMPPETRLTGAARLAVADDGTITAGFLPAWIDDSSVPHMLEPADRRFAEVADYLAAISAEAGLTTRFRTVDGEVRFD